MNRWSGRENEPGKAVLTSGSLRRSLKKVLQVPSSSGAERTGGIKRSGAPRKHVDRDERAKGMAEGKVLLFKDVELTGAKIERARSKS